MPQGAGTLITVAQQTVSSGAGTVATLEQTVGYRGAGTIVTVAQTVKLRKTGAGTLVSIAQRSQNAGSGTLVTLSQNVRSNAVLNSVQKHGWDAELYIDGVKVEPWHIHGQINITRTENSAALMTVTLINKTGAIDIAAFHGKPIFLNIETSAGIERAYTGTVDIPEFDIINKLITLRCTDKRTELINSQLGSQLKFIGTWSSAIFEEPDDVAEELEQRLQTTTKTVDFDAYGQFTISDFLPKATPDFTLRDWHIYRRKPSIQVASRGRLVNRVTIEFTYQYVRLRQRERDFELFGPSFCDVSTTPGLTFMRVDGIKSNLKSFAWDVDWSSVSYDYLPGKGWQTCNGKRFLWNPTSTYADTSTKKDSNGNTVTDSDGNPITEVSITRVVDYSKTYATHVAFTAAKRFAQDIEQKLNITIDAPQSQNQYGVIERKLRHGLKVDFDTLDFENQKGYQPPTGMTAVSGADYYLDKNGDIADFNNAVNTAVNIAKTQIIKSHRDNHVTVETELWPAIDLKHTVKIDAAVMQAHGKVSQVIHTIDITSRAASTTVRLSLSKAVGTQTDDVINIPMTTPPLAGETNPGALLMYTQKDYQPGTGNLPVTFLPGGQTQTPVVAQEAGLITPPIDDASRNAHKTEQNYTFNVSIRNDLLDITY